jgi:hypothetical protein
MTAFAIDFRKTRATVAADTLGYIPDLHEVRPIGFINKILPLPHLKAVLVARGQQQILVQAWAGLYLVPQMLDVEDAAGALPAMLQFSTQTYCVEQGIQEDPTGFGLLEVVLLGWSEREKRMRLWQFQNMQDYQPHDAGEYYGLHILPTLPANYVPRVHNPATDRDLVRAVEAAGRYFVDHPELCCGARVGGEVVCTDLTPRGLTHRTLHRFADYEATRHAVAAIVAGIGRGDLDVSTAVRDGLVPADQMVDSRTGLRLVA